LKHPFKLYVNLTEGNYDDSIIQKIKEYHEDSVIIISENKGVDIGGFLNTLKVIDKDTDLILKIHTKKGIGSSENPSASVRRRGLEYTTRISRGWFNNLMGGVLKDETFVNNVLNKFETDQTCGMVGFRLYDSYAINKSEIIRLFPLFKMNEQAFNYKFIGGTMFWVRYSIINKYFTDEVIDFILRNTKPGYVIEPSISHAVERILGYIVQQENQNIVVM